MDLVKSVLMRAESRAPNPDPIGGLVEDDNGGPISTGLGSGPLMNEFEPRFLDPFDGRFVGSASVMGSSGKAT